MSQRSFQISITVTFNLSQFASIKHLDISEVVEYKSNMKIKTSITLSEDIVTAIDGILGESMNRSALIESALRAYLGQRAKESREDKDLKILNKNSERLNREAEDVLSYQVKL